MHTQFIPVSSPGEIQKKRVLFDDLTWEGDSGGLEFRLTYEGLLLSANASRDRKPARNAFRQDVRRCFHLQLKRLWQTVPFLKNGEMGGPDIGGYAAMARPKFDLELLAKKNARYGFNFAPLVTDELRLSCWIDVLYLRREEPGGVIDHFDIDNRIKTLFDCLQIPDSSQGYESLSPQEDEKPFFCLMENDRLISKVSVETDTLLEDIAGREPNQHDARLVITVRLRPYEMHFGNMAFG